MTLPGIAKMEQFIAESKFLDETCNQISKDFDSVEVEFSKEGLNSYPHLIKQLENQVNRLLELDSTKLFRFLYLVDIEDEKVKQILFDQNRTNPALELSDLIVKRELLKVLTRNHFKSQQ